MPPARGGGQVKRFRFCGGLAPQLSLGDAGSGPAHRRAQGYHGVLRTVFHALGVLAADGREVALDLGQRVAPYAVELVAGADQLLSNAEPVDLIRFAVASKLGRVWKKKSAFTSSTTAMASATIISGIASTSDGFN